MRVTTNTTVNTTSTSETRGRDRSRSTSQQARPLMLPQEVKDLPYSEELIFMQGNKSANPLQVKARKIFWYEEEVFKARHGLDLPYVPTATPTELDRLTTPMHQTKSTVSIFATETAKNAENPA